MRHLKKVKKLGRTSSHRKALLRNQAISLILNGKIKSTVPKLKETKKFVERLVTIAKEDTQSSRRLVFSYLNNKEASQKIFEIAKNFKDRKGGYTRLIRLGFRRGDNAEEGLLEFVE
ncbi:MAG: 50S ribosomal protein L17 [Candidatus Hydrothermales bacterium]